MAAKVATEVERYIHFAYGVTSRPPAPNEGVKLTNELDVTVHSPVPSMFGAVSDRPGQIRRLTKAAATFQNAPEICIYFV